MRDSHYEGAVGAGAPVPGQKTDGMLAAGQAYGLERTELIKSGGGEQYREDRPRDRLVPGPFEASGVGRKLEGEARAHAFVVVVTVLTVN